MSQAAKHPEETTVAAEPRRFAAMWWSFILVGLVMLVAPIVSHAESRTGSTRAQASLAFRIVVPAIIRVKAVTQPDHIVIEDRHIADGYIDLDAGTSVNLTVNTRNGYLLSARYDSQLLSKVEVRVASQNLTASSGHGSMRVASGRMTDMVVPISYRLHLAPGVRAGGYHWPVALAFSLTSA